MKHGRRIVATTAGLVACGIAIALGNWQSERATAKIALERQWLQLESAPPHALDRPEALRQIEQHLPARVRVRGQPQHERSIWLANRIVDGRPGYYVVTPVRLAEAAGVVLVNRGWVARDVAARDQPAASSLPSIGRPEAIDIEGVAVREVPRLLALGAPMPASPLPAVWQNLDLDAARNATHLPLAGFVVQQTSPADDGLIRRWPRVAGNPQMNRGYAFQWYALAALIGTLTMYFSLRDLVRRPPARRDRHESP